MKSAGTKWGIPPDSPEDSTPDPAPAESVSSRDAVTEEQPAREKQVRLDSRLRTFNSYYHGGWFPRQTGLASAEKGVSGTARQLSRDESLPATAVEGDEGSSPAQQISAQKKPLQKSKSLPARSTKRGYA